MEELYSVVNITPTGTSTSSNGICETGDEKIIKNMLKLNNEVQDSEYSKVKIESNTNELNVKLTYYYEVSEEENKKQKDALEKEKMTLESNIARREKLLSNPGFVNNAPKALVEEEKIKLENEKKELTIILEKLK